MQKQQNASHPGKRIHINRFDIFVAFNTVLHMIATYYAYTVSEWEFGLYAVVILVVGFAVWRVFRRYEYPYWMLVLLQIGIIANFVGGFVRIDGHAVYWHHLAGIRIDKIVHFYNSAVIAVILTYVVREANMRLKPMEGFLIIAARAGLGTIVEMVEYVAVRLLPSTGVGDYANTLEDLISNMLGAVFGYVAFRMLEGLSRKNAEGLD